MHAVARQRCLNHSTREAVARCPECAQFFCRECITEHDDRVICAACLKKLAFAGQKPRRGVVNFWPAIQGAGGFVVTWLFFYIIGRMLLAVPEEYHHGNVWKEKFLDLAGGRNEEE